MRIVIALLIVIAGVGALPGCAIRTTTLPAVSAPAVSTLPAAAPVSAPPGDPLQSRILDLRFPDGSAITGPASPIHENWSVPGSPADVAAELGARLPIGHILGVPLDYPGNHDVAGEYWCSSQPAADGSQVWTWRGRRTVIVDVTPYGGGDNSSVVITVAPTVNTRAEDGCEEP